MENNENNFANEINNNMRNNQKKKSNVGLIIVIILLVIAVLAWVYFVLLKGGNGLTDETEVSSENEYLTYSLSGNTLEDFDLYFLQLENEKENKVYSPLSIKYALLMLEEGANGETKKQISNILGSYNAKKYNNNANMSFANALFIRDTFKDSIKSSYIDTLSKKYNADVIYDSFSTPDTLNSWVSEKTFKLINNMADDISTEDFILANALAIDMEWVKKIQDVHKDYKVKFEHEKFTKYVMCLSDTDYHGLDFKDFSGQAKSVDIGAVANRYDIVNILGEDKIRETVGKEYDAWLASGGCGDYVPIEDEPDTNTYLDTYIKELNSSYKHISSSTDFEFYDDDNVKVFAKDLKKYDGITLQYVGIMPKNDSLDSYISSADASSINTLVSNLKPIELESFKDGVITEISGYIPMFNFDYKLNLLEDLNTLGITNIFNPEKADLSNLSSEGAFIDKAEHKANIEFSNEGIKAAAATALGGKGAAGCKFDYLYDVPIEKIDLTFDNPYMFIIRDKDTGEVWFVGTVYEPVEYKRGELTTN